MHFKREIADDMNIQGLKLELYNIHISIFIYIQPDNCVLQGSTIISHKSYSDVISHKTLHFNQVLWLSKPLM